eukprot:m.487327 g.487327  ORF g.487327 m.487327 type:complete len:182 (+) comp24945_c0_seq1:154-699(+)
MATAASAGGKRKRTQASSAVNAEEETSEATVLFDQLAKQKQHKCNPDDEEEQEDVEGEDEDEEVLVLADVNGIAIPEFLKLAAEKSTMRLARLSSSSPLLQIGSLFFKGEYQETLGTDVLFQEAAAAQGEESMQRPTLKYFTSTTKRLCFDRVFPQRQATSAETAGIASTPAASAAPASDH